ncbi:DUF6054 family protein [Alkaliphilus oremlandii]|uniref:Uncharacterized protein n=1 Tax=Alkaliphilus oremlandii (strain OhILAs) TaxID=350688 RepID=A8MLA2_ALKOO|nr:DUF6054 family protein [Alkaliphilus oremlandii]ABW17919.1 conserved hypothetical protein [Alkaliphilus oremlandii OhILAs]
MSKYIFNVSVSPVEAMEIVKDRQSADLVHEELLDLGDGRYVATLIYEKYYFRANNRAALIVIMDNVHGTTSIRSISTGSSEGFFFNFDWGAADDFAGSVERIFKDFMI